MSRYCASALLTITVALATLIALKFDVSATLANVMPPNSYENEGRQLGARRRHRRAVAEARGMHNRTRGLIPLVESELRLAAHRRAVPRRAAQRRAAQRRAAQRRAAQRRAVQAAARVRVAAVVVASVLGLLPVKAELQSRVFCVGQAPSMIAI